MDMMAEGTYEAVTKSAVLYESKGNALMCVLDIEVDGRIMKGWITLVQKDGTLSERGIKNVQEVLGWTGWDWAAFEGSPSDFGGHACSVVIATENDQQGNPESKIKYVNAPGGGIQKADAKAMAAKYSAKFRAVLGGAAPAARPTAAAPKPLHPPTIPPAAASAGMSTMPDCWGAICDAMKGKPQEVIEAAWFRLIEKVGGGKAVEAMTHAEWGKAKALIMSVPKSAAAATKPATAPEPAPAAADPGDSENTPF
jgi:hypothetical protein